MPDPPFAYAAHRGRDNGVLVICPTLEAASQALAKDEVGKIWEGYLTAWWPDGSFKVVPVEVYKEPKPETREAAIRFIRRRQDLIESDIEAGKDPIWHKVMGLDRCLHDDPVEKQIIDYIASSPWVFRAEPEERWWESK